MGNKDIIKFLKVRKWEIRTKTLEFGQSFEYSEALPFPYKKNLRTIFEDTIPVGIFLSFWKYSPKINFRCF